MAIGPMLGQPQPPTRDILESVRGADDHDIPLVDVIVVDESRGEAVDRVLVQLCMRVGKVEVRACQERAALKLK